MISFRLKVGRNTQKNRNECLSQSSNFVLNRLGATYVEMCKHFSKIQLIIILSCSEV